MLEIKEMIEEYLKILPTNYSVTAVEAEKRAGQFLVACAKLADFRHIITEEKIRLTSVEKAVFATKINEDEAKTITEKKLNVEANKDYASAREELERIENDLSYLKAYSDIFNNAHIMYRQISKGETL